jgi:hypothetical protein
VAFHNTLPPRLEAFLLDIRFTFTGCQVGGDISKIFSTFKNDKKTKDVARLELGSYAKNRGVVASGTAKMEKLHLILTGEHLNKELQTSDWNKRNLDVEQI